MRFSELWREAAGSFVLFAFGGGATALVVHSGWWRVPAIALGFAVGQMAARAITGGPVLRVNPAATLISWTRCEISAGMAWSSALVQIGSMTVACASVRTLTGASVTDLAETTPSITLTVAAVAGASIIWFVALVRQPDIGRLGMLYGLLHLVGLPCHGGSLNPARTLAPILLGAPVRGAIAFSVPPIGAALAVALISRPSPGHLGPVSGGNER